MEVMTAINGRRSVRAFTPEPVPNDVLEAIMEAALKAPSWENTQPWEFAVIGGGCMDKLRSAIMDKLRAGEKPNLEIPWPHFKGSHMERAKTGGRRLFQELGITKDDTGAIMKWRLSMTQFFGAPNGVIVYMDVSLNEWSILDIGLALQNLMLAAWNHGVGTCALSAAVMYPDVLRSVLNIPGSKRIVLGVAVGYPDFSSKAATFRADRESMETLVTWHGFD
ncbi:MAG: nitroreductase [Chloroflexi bacterium]|nr:nitroreductase [Chloroflexota bacterium]